MKKLLTNAKIFDENYNKFRDVNILINENIIEKIYDNNEKFAKNYEFLNENDDFDVVDCKNNIIIYGFINSQSYLLKNFFESFVSMLSYEEFNEKFDDFLNGLSLEEKYYIYKFQILNLIKNGIVAFCDSDFFNLALKKAVKETNINVVYKIGIQNCFEEFDQKSMEKLIRENSNFILALDSVLKNTEQNFDEIIKLSKLNNKPVLINGSESLLDAGNVETEFNKTSPQLLEEYGFLDVENVLLNSNVLDKEDYEILSGYNSKLIFSPSLNLSFGFKNANIYALDKTNIIGLSSFKNNYELEMFLANNLENENYNKIEIFSSKKLYEFATKNNAKILGLEGFGEIKEGNFANLIVTKNDNMLCDCNLFLKNFENSKIISVMINGNFVYASNHFVLNNDYEHVKKLCFDIIKKHFK